MKLARVAVPVPLAKAFTYEVPEAMLAELCPGARVLCDFGRRKIIGVVLGIDDGPPPAGITPKPLRALVDPVPVLPEELLGFLVQVADYYFAPIGEVLRLALPALERGKVDAMKAQGELLDTSALARQKRVAEPTELVAEATSATEEPGKLRGQAREILALLRASGPSPVARLEERYSNARPATKRLAELGLVVLTSRLKASGPAFAERIARDEAPELVPAQAEAVTRITAALEPGATERAFLLFGVTGSGKTEVYLHAIEACLERRRGALVMVPEIALTPQLVERYRARFGDEVAVVHSGLSDRARHAMWKRLAAGELRVAIGARSALFAPVPDLGLVVVDEEHDPSFKQEEGVRYHARDMALLRAHRAGAAVVLGSATPSLESAQLAKRGRLVMLRLPARANLKATLPEVRIVDLKRIGPGPTGDKRISLPLHRALEQTLAQGEQAIIFLNRRGHSPTVVCTACGTVETCKGCSVSLTFHKLRGHSVVRCHYCGYEDELYTRCSACGASALELEGLGTEKLEETLAEAFPTARVARLDRDVAEGAKAEAILNRMKRHEIDILVGTQMVTKGHDLPKVTLVGVVNADAALGMPDFRAAERSFQLLVQVAGRAGRHERKGQVIVQTKSPEHAAVVYSAKHDVEGFLAVELKDRAEVGYPPFSRLVLLRIDAIDPEVAERAATQLAQAARATAAVRAGAVEVLGPAPAPLTKLRGRTRFRVMLRATERPPLRATVAALGPALESLDRRVRAIVDVDPQAML
jgi:primosomal protein N' (replication factor Y)